jgi:hypothetical protein
VSPVKYELGFYVPEDDILQHNKEARTDLWVGSSGCRGHWPARSDSADCWTE